MEVSQIAKSTQEQAVAAWIDQLNQLRLDELLAKLADQDINLEQALAELQKMKAAIDDVIKTKTGKMRGNTKGVHGFIAEIAEVYIQNARNLIKGLDASCKWINDNGPADILRNSTEIQQKFMQSGGHFGLEAIKAHFEKYPDFLQKGGKYQIPKDFYDELQRILSLSQEEAAKESAQTYRLWKWVQAFFKNNPQISMDAIEPSVNSYSAVQTG